MEKIKINFLGTGQAIPTQTRNHMGILLTYKNETILVDCGEGTQRQFRMAQLNPCRITRLLITHWHGDHVLGIPGLLQTLALNNYTKTLQVVGPQGTKKYMQELLHIFMPAKKLKIQINEVTGRFFENDDFFLQTVSLYHSVPVNGYAFIEKDKLKIKKQLLQKKLKTIKIGKNDLNKIESLKHGKDIILQGKLFKAKELTYKEEGRKISFVFDTGIGPNTIQLAKDSEIAIIESTYGADELEQALEHKHLTAPQAADIAKKAKVKNLILTHISQRYEFKEKILLEQAKKIFLNTKIAVDLMSMEI
ncbi:MAG: ribonuclease Z [Nanoarchaeota archaeon]